VHPEDFIGKIGVFFSLGYFSHQKLVVCGVQWLDVRKKKPKWRPTESWKVWNWRRFELRKLNLLFSERISLDSDVIMGHYVMTPLGFLWIILIVLFTRLSTSSADYVVLLDTTKEDSLDWTRYPFGPQSATPGVSQSPNSIRIHSYSIAINSSQLPNMHSWTILPKYCQLMNSFHKCGQL